MPVKRTDWERMSAVRIFAAIVCPPGSEQEKDLTVHCPILWMVSSHFSIRLPIPRTELFKKSVYYVGSKLRNDLDENIRDIKDLDDFKKNIKAIYVDC